jgi:hypothetical protein
MGVILLPKKSQAVVIESEKGVIFNVIQENMPSSCCCSPSIVFGPPGLADGDSLGQWTICNSGTTNELTAVAYGNGLFVATCYCSPISGQGVIMTSPDGTTWTSQYVLNTSLYDVAYGNGTFVAVGTGTKLFEKTSILTPSNPNSFTTSSWGESGGAILGSQDGKQSVNRAEIE